MAYRDDVIAVANSSSFRGFWMLEETSGTVATDLSTHSQDLIYVGTPADAGYVLARPGVVSDATAAVGLNQTDVTVDQDGGLSFGGMSTNITVNWTVILWHENLELNPGKEQILFHYATAVNLNEVLFGIDVNGQYFCEYQGGARATFALPGKYGSAYGFDRRMVTIKRSTTSTRLILDINGDYQETISGTGGGTINNPGTLTVGKGQSAFSVQDAAGVRPFRGAMQSLAVWSTTLSQAQLRPLYLSGRGKYIPYEIVESVSPADLPPVIQNFSPAAPASLAKDTSISFDVTNAGLDDTKITAAYSSGRTDVIFANTVPAGDYSIGTSISGSTTTYTVSRVNGWLENFDLKVEATSAKRTVAATQSGYTLDSPEYPPNMQPTF